MSQAARAQGANDAHDRRLGVQIRHLAALAAIAREGSFRAAADHLGYAPSAVSSQLVQLERLVGARLVERTRGRGAVELTRAGRMLCEHAEVLLDHLEAARVELAEVAETGRALRVGAFDAAATHLLPRIEATFAAARPEVRVERLEAPDDAPLLDGLERQEIDLALCELPLGRGNLACIELLDDPYVLVVGVGSSLARRRTPPTPSELGRLPLVGLNRSRPQTRLVAALRERGIEPQFKFGSDLPATAQALAGAGVGVALLPRLAVDPEHAATRLIDLPDLPARSIGVAWRADGAPSAAARSFVAAARAACAGELGSERPAAAARRPVSPPRVEA